MLRILKNVDAGALTVQLAGNFDDQANLDNSIGSVTGSLKVRCREVTRINSIGIKHWRTYFGNLRKANVRLSFEEISSPLVEQMNFLADFIRPDEIGSVCATYYCSGCRNEDLKIYTVQELRKLDLANLVQPCPNCGAQASFDEIPEVYFAFLEAKG